MKIKKTKHFHIICSKFYPECLVLKGMVTLCSFPSLFAREIISVALCFLSCTISSFSKEVFSKRKECAPTGSKLFLKGKNLLPLGANSFLLEKTLFQKGSKAFYQSCRIRKVISESCDSHIYRMRFLAPMDGRICALVPSFCASARKVHGNLL